jgi:hypothetical protein
LGVDGGRRLEQPEATCLADERPHWSITRQVTCRWVVPEGASESPGANTIRNPCKRNGTGMTSTPPVAVTSQATVPTSATIPVESLDVVDVFLLSALRCVRRTLRSKHLTRLRSDHVG